MLDMYCCECVSYIMSIVYSILSKKENKFFDYKKISQYIHVCMILKSGKILYLKEKAHDKTKNAEWLQI